VIGLDGSNSVGVTSGKELLASTGDAIDDCVWTAYGCDGGPCTRWGEV
jgi:hypothetical protein